MNGSFRDGRSARRRLLDVELETLKSVMTGRVLEIGNGRSGRRGAFRPPAEARSWTYLDLDRGRLPHVCGDTARLPFRNGVFDTVVCLEVLEYVGTPDAALREIARALRLGGTLIMSTPFHTRPDTDGDLWRFTEPGLRRLAAGAALDVTAVRRQGGVAAAVLQIMPVWRRSARIRERLAARALSPLMRLLWNEDRQPNGTSAGHTTGYVLVARKARDAGNVHVTS